VDVVIAANLQSVFGSNHPLAAVEWSTVPAFQRLGIATDISIVEMDETSAQLEEVRAALTV